MRKIETSIMEKAYKAVSHLSAWTVTKVILRFKRSKIYRVKNRNWKKKEGKLEII